MEHVPLYVLAVLIVGTIVGFATRSFRQAGIAQRAVDGVREREIQRMVDPPHPR